ncbi:MAG: hypothetical protein RLZZ584_3142 [Pseudomonadota bacterium]|jgi:hypothetical protein
MAHAQVMQPLLDEMFALNRQEASRLDEMLDQRGWTAAERSTLVELVCSISGNLLQEHGDDDDPKALFARTTGPPPGAGSSCSAS